MTFLTYLTLLLTLGVAAQYLAWRFKLPSILLLLGFGFALSQTTGVQIDNYLENQDVLLSLVGYFVAIILFEGGLTLKFSELKEAGAPVARLCTVAVAIAFVLGTIAARMALGFDWLVCALVGAILVVTGPTVVAPLLRLIQPRRKVASIVKWEGIVVDPIGAILAVLVFQAIQQGGLWDAWDSVALALLQTLLLGCGLGFALAKLTEYLLREHLIPDFLESLYFLALIAAAFVVSNAIQHESGLLTVTVMGVLLANQKTVSVRHILEFKEHLRVLIISLLFLMLSGRVTWPELHAVWLKGLILLVLLIVVVRPASIFISNLGSNKATMKEQLFLAFLAPRGIVAAAVMSVFALEIAHLAEDHGGSEKLARLAEQAEQLVPLVFLIILGTVAFYGLLAAPLARKLGLSTSNPDGILFAGADPWIVLVAKELQENGHQVLLLDTQFTKVAAAKMEGLRALRANILSEYVEEEMDFAGLGHLVAATPNDEVNSMAGREFVHRFGRANVWQLTPADRDDHHSKAVAEHMRGRRCFLPGPTFGDLTKLAADGAVVKTTQLTEKFTLDDFFRHNGEDAVVLFEKHPEKGLRPIESGREAEDFELPTTIYSLVVEGEEEVMEKVAERLTEIAEKAENVEKAVEKAKEQMNSEPANDPTDPERLP